MFDKIERDNIIYNDTNSKEKRELISEKLVEFNKAQSQKIFQCYKSEPDSPDLIEIYAEIKPQKLIGGLISFIDWGWLDIDTIWIDSAYRNKGIGKYLVASAEQKAIDRNIKRSKIYTFDFQALDFYKKLGYTIYGELEDFPEGHTAYYLKKNLIDS